ncbi:MAG: hypothetical protein LBS19_03655 [Clostridiales bacterium]|nr:hypothetical protein [Clostridiales bacterium]
MLVDTCPTLDLLAVNALAAADSAIIRDACRAGAFWSANMVQVRSKAPTSPVTPKYLDAKGLSS